MVDIMNNKRFISPKCNSQEYEISRRFIQEKRLNEYVFHCLNCNHTITSLGNLQKINRECKYKEVLDE